jgi:uncharacterized protein DUF4154
MRCLGIVLVASVWIAATALAQERVAPEEVKAAFLFRFGEYVEWPEPWHEGPVVIAVLDDPAVAAQLRRILPGRHLLGRPVEVRELRQVQEAAHADILFIGAGVHDTLRRTIAAAASHANRLLIVTDHPDGLDAGAAINFVIRDRRIRFEVSPAAAEAEGLKLSSRLLAVADRVASGP